MGTRLVIGRIPTIADLRERRMELLRIGDPLDKNTDIGAINSKEQLDRIVELTAAGVDEGADVIQSSCPLPDRGWFYPPTILAGVDTSSRVATEEIFGPVLAQMSFRTPEEAVAKANATPYGLAAGVWPDLDSLRKLGSAAKTFTPRWPEDMRKKHVAGWRRAVQAVIAYYRAGE